MDRMDYNWYIKLFNYPFGLSLRKTNIKINNKKYGCNASIVFILLSVLATARICAGEDEKIIRVDPLGKRKFYEFWHSVSKYFIFYYPNQKFRKLPVLIWYDTQLPQAKSPTIKFFIFLAQIISKTILIKYRQNACSFDIKIYINSLWNSETET